MHTYTLIHTNTYMHTDRRAYKRTHTHIKTHTYRHTVYIPSRTGDNLDSSIANRDDLNRSHILRVLTRPHSNLYGKSLYTNT